MARNRRNVEHDLAAVERKIQSVVAAIEAGGDPRALAAKLNELEAERRTLEQVKPGKAAASPYTRRQPRTLRRRSVSFKVLGAGPPNTGQAVGFVRELIDRIEIRPTRKGTPVDIDLVGNLTALFLEPSANRVVKTLVAGAGFEPTTFRL